MNQVNDIIKNFKDLCEKALCEHNFQNLESMKSDPSFMKDIKYLRNLLGDRLLAYALACDDLTKIENQIGLPQIVITSMLAKILENMVQKTLLNKIILIKCTNCTRDLIMSTIFPDVQTPAERLICQIAKNMFSQKLLPRENKYEKYAKIMLNDIWYTLDDIIKQSEQYDDLLLLLTQDSFKLRNIFPDMKKETEYQELAKTAKEKGIPVKDIFNDLSVFYATRCSFSEIPYNIISNAIYNFTNNISKDLHEFIQSVLQEFRSFISLAAEKKIKVKHIYGLNIYINAVNTIDNIQIRPITDSDKQFLPIDFVTKCSDGSALAVYEQEEEYSLDLLLSKSDKYNINITKQLDRQIQFMKIAAAITLAYSDYISAHSDFSFSEYKYNFIALQEVFAFTLFPFTSNSENSVKECRKVTINDDVISQAGIYLKQLNSLSEDVVYSLLMAMYRLLSAPTKLDVMFGDAIVDAIIVWESLLGSERNITDNLATVIHLIGIADKTEIKRLYSIRSKIVHGTSKMGKINLNKSKLSTFTQENALSIYSDFQKIIKIAVDLFKYVIFDDELKQMNNSEKRAKHILDKLPFGCIKNKCEIKEDDGENNE